MLKTTIEIDGKPVVFKASAAIPRIYRIKFRRDIYKDLRLLEKSVGENDEDDSHLDLFSLELFENIAYIMAKHADPSIPDSPEEWLDDVLGNPGAKLPGLAPESGAGSDVSGIILERLAFDVRQNADEVVRGLPEVDDVQRRDADVRGTRQRLQLPRRENGLQTLECPLEKTA